MQRSHVPHQTPAPLATTAPVRNAESAPASTISPMNSWPKTIGPVEPVTGCTRFTGKVSGPAFHSVASVPHMPDRSTRSSTSPGRRSGRGTSVIRTSWAPW